MTLKSFYGLKSGIGCNQIRGIRMTLGTALTILLAIQILCAIIGWIIDSEFMFKVSYFSFILMPLVIIQACLDLKLR